MITIKPPSGVKAWPTAAHMERLPGRTHLFRGTEPSLWQFWRDGVTSSFIDSFDADLEQCRLHYVEGWSSKLVPIYLEFGSCCHWILERAYRSFAVQRQVPSREWVYETVEKYKAYWTTTVEKPTEMQLEQQEMVYGLADRVIPYYFVRWSGDFTGTYEYPNQTTHPDKWVNLEEEFGEEFVLPDGRKTFLRGKRDGIFKDIRGRVWTFDTKCKSVIVPDTILDTLPFDPQQMLYLLVTAKELQRKQGPKSWPAGNIMNIIRRPQQHRRKGEALDAYLDRVEKEVSNPKTFDHYFQRYQMALTPGEIAGWQNTTLLSVMSTIRMWWDGRLPHYLRGRSLEGKYGKCQLYMPIIRGDFLTCYKRKRPFPELNYLAGAK